MIEQYEKAKTPFAEIDIDYAGFHGPVAHAYVWDNNDLMHNVYLKSLLLIGYDCESDWHAEDASDCDCVTEDTYRQAFVNRCEQDNVTIVEEIL